MYNKWSFWGEKEEKNHKEIIALGKTETRKIKKKFDIP